VGCTRGYEGKVNDFTCSTNAPRSKAIFSFFQLGYFKFEDASVSIGGDDENEVRAFVPHAAKLFS
jgi:hypothetical protein